MGLTRSRAYSLGFAQESDLIDYLENVGIHNLVFPMPAVREHAVVVEYLEDTWRGCKLFPLGQLMREGATWVFEGEAISLRVR
jgi:hypothetical protein